VLTPEQRKSGAVVIDLGAGTTDYLAYADGVIAAAGALGLGGDHITNDIALGFNVPTAQAEHSKCEWGCARVIDSMADKRVSIPPEVGFAGKSLSLKSLHTVINARVNEILEMIKRRLDDDNILPHVGTGVVLVGGGAHLRGVTEEAERIFGLPCSVGKPHNVSGLAMATEGPQYAVCSGLVQYGFRMTSTSRKRALRPWLKKFFGG
jgi:cell division protein FtsA